MRTKLTSAVSHTDTLFEEQHPGQCIARNPRGKKNLRRKKTKKSSDLCEAAQSTKFL